MPDQDTLSTSDPSDDDGVWLNPEEDGEDDDDEDDDEEEESTVVISLLDDRVFPDALSMIRYCHEKFGLDFLGVRDRLGLDFHGSVRLINFIRQRVHEGIALPEEITAADIQDDRYLKPVLEDDALILCLDDLPDSAEAAAAASAAAGAGDKKSESLAQKNAELAAELERVTQQFANYRLAVQQTLDRRWGGDDDQPDGDDGDDDGKQTGAAAKAKAESSGGAARNLTAAEADKDDSEYYFSSYAYNDIHETMLKDAVRTDAYRDFIYGNKHLFADKVVLDVGCGTGILAMFCAKAGARRVIAVDNSAIVDKARENVFRNGLDGVVSCLRGKIEEVTLPVDKVDIIVSEWMGYCLLYEAMLPSVVWARDRYLRPGGLMVPSHAALWVAPVADPEYVADNVTFWRDVYGFDMRAMQADIHRDARVVTMPEAAVCGAPAAFQSFDLRVVRPADLVFDSRWESALSRDVDRLDGFLIWFDIFFGTRGTGDNGNSGDEDPNPATTTAREWSSSRSDRVAFTTGPFGTETHWRQGLLLNKEAHDNPGAASAKGALVRGGISYRVAEGHARGLTLEVAWEAEGKAKQSQTWLLR